MPSAEKEALTMEPLAFWIALATVILVAGVAGFTAWDRAHLAVEEQVITPTAVGDVHYVEEPKIGTGPIGLNYHGQALGMVAEDKVRDSKLIRVGADDTGVYSLYRPEDEKAGLPKDQFYMKVKPNEFMVVTVE